MTVLSVTTLRKSRNDHMRRAETAKFFADHATNAEAARIWRAQCRAHVRAARFDNRLIVARLREWSATKFTRRTVFTVQPRRPHNGYLRA